MKRLTFALLGSALIIATLNSFMGNADGYEGVDVLANVAILWICLIVLYLRCTALEIPPLPILVAMLFATLCSGRCLLIGGGNLALLCFIGLVAFITAKPEWGRWKHLGALAIFILWANGHSSFIYGFLLIQTRFALELIAKLWERGLVIARAEASSFWEYDIPAGNSGLPLSARSAEYDVSGWFITTIAAGLALLYRVIVIKPLPRSLSGDLTAILSHWHLHLSVYNIGLADNSLWFIVFLVIVLVSLIATVTLDGLNPLLRKFISRGIIVIAMEWVVSLTSVLMAFRNRNLTVLAAFALVPLGALLIHCALESLEDYFTANSGSTADRVWSVAAFLSGIALIALLFSNA
jgi:hypothetical protein